MWKGKNKAITFSFDDGVLQDIRLIELFNKYGVKGTFNINSGRCGTKGTIPYANGTKIGRHDKVSPQDIKRVYDGHEVAVHTLTHPSLPTIDDGSVIYQVETDRKLLSELCGYEVIGMAYPGGPPNNDQRVRDLIKNNTGVKYARSFPSTHTFELPNDLYCIEGSVYIQQVEKMFQLGKEFVELQTKSPKLFYVWGHSYEFDQDNITWEIFEEFLKLVSNKSDIFYGTNKEVLL